MARIEFVAVCLLLLACGDSSAVDAGALADVRLPDVSVFDDAASDVGGTMVDVGARDAAERDAGLPDAGDDALAIADAGSDAPTDAGSDAREADAGPATVTRTYRAWVWNVAGHLIHRGSTTDGLIEAAVSSIVSRDIDFVGFNELCGSQYRALQAALRDAGWPSTDNFSRFAEGRPAGTAVCGGTNFGNAIFSREPLGGASRLMLPEDGRTETRSLLCAPLADLPHMRWCTTHVTTSSEVGADGFAANVRQLRFIQRQLLDWHDEGDTVLIGGDFNAQPHYGRLNRFYAPSVDTAVNGDNRGVHRELDDLDERCLGHGERTVAEPTGGPCDTGVKIDLFFAREDEIVGSYDSDSLSISNACGGACSDHRIIIGEVTLSIREP